MQNKRDKTLCYNNTAKQISSKKNKKNSSVLPQV